jgi:hypothetical protein
MDTTPNTKPDPIVNALTHLPATLLFAPVICLKSISQVAFQKYRGTLTTTNFQQADAQKVSRANHPHEEIVRDETRSGMRGRPALGWRLQRHPAWQFNAGTKPPGARGSRRAQVRRGLDDSDVDQLKARCVASCSRQKVRR